jgi:hypothetical protein
MSALPPKADMDRRCRHVCLVPKADICSAVQDMTCGIARLFDHFVGECEQLVRYGQAERLGGREVDDRADFGGLLDLQVAR